MIYVHKIVHWKNHVNIFKLLNWQSALEIFTFIGHFVVWTVVCEKVFFSLYILEYLCLFVTHAGWICGAANGSWTIYASCAITNCAFWPTLICKSLCSGPKRKLTEPKIRWLEQQNSKQQTGNRKWSKRRKTTNFIQLRTRHRVDFITHNLQLTTVVSILLHIIYCVGGSDAYSAYRLQWSPLTCPVGG